MKAIEKLKLSRELNQAIASVQAGAIKSLEKLKLSRRINEIVALLGGGSNVASLAQQGADDFHQNLKQSLEQTGVDLSPFERIVKDEITLETLQGAVDSTKMLLNSATVPPVFLDAVKVVSKKLTSGALLDSLGGAGAGAALINQLAHMMLDSINTQQLPDAIAQAAATSVINEGEDPSQQQLEANDYKTAKVNIAGMNIAIENPIDSVRKGVDDQGQAWQTTMTAHYGYFEDTLGADGDELDVFIAADVPHDYDGKVFIINQLDANGNFDEHKVILGVNSNNEAQHLYQAHYDENANGIGQIVELSIEQFKSRVFTGQTALFDSVKGMMLDSWADDGSYDLLPMNKLDRSKLDADLKEAKATIKEPIVVFAVKSKYYVIHGNKRLEIAKSHGEKYVPSIVFDADQGYTIADIKAAVRKCGSVVHAEALGAMIELTTSKRLESELV